MKCWLNVSRTTRMGVQSQVQPTKKHHKTAVTQRYIQVHTSKIAVRLKYNVTEISQNCRRTQV